MTVIGEQEKPGSEDSKTVTDDVVTEVVWVTTVVVVVVVVMGEQESWRGLRSGASAAAGVGTAVRGTMGLVLAVALLGGM